MKFRGSAQNFLYIIVLDSESSEELWPLHYMSNIKYFLERMNMLLTIG